MGGNPAQCAFIEWYEQEQENVYIEALTLAMLASQLGIRTPTLYHYVNGLDGLRQNLALQGKRELARVIGIAIMGRSGSDAVEAKLHTVPLPMPILDSTTQFNGPLLQKIQLCEKQMQKLSILFYVQSLLLRLNAMPQMI